MHPEDEAWLDYRKRFSRFYDQANYAGCAQSFSMRASHRLVERGFGPRQAFARVLEVGAGTGEHFAFVRHGFDEYVLTDHDAELLHVARGKIGPAAAGRARFEVQSAGGLSYEDASFDRVLAVHVLEHLYQPHLAIKEWLRVLRPGGVLSVLIPTDPGLAWRAGRHLGPRRSALAQGIAYDYVMAREHVNPCTNLIGLLRHYCPRRREAWWPLPLPSVDLNLFFAFHAVVAPAGGTR